MKFQVEELDPELSAALEVVYKHTLTPSAAGPLVRAYIYGRSGTDGNCNRKEAGLLMAATKAAEDVTSEERRRDIGETLTRSLSLYDNFPVCERIED